MANPVYKVIPLKLVAATLPKVKRQVAMGLKRLALTRDGDVVAYLVPIGDIPENLRPLSIKLPIRHQQALEKYRADHSATNDELFSVSAWVRDIVVREIEATPDIRQYL